MKAVRFPSPEDHDKHIAKVVEEIMKRRAAQSPEDYDKLIAKALEELKKLKHTEIAGIFSNWREYFDTGATMTEAEFEATPMPERLKMLADAFGEEEKELPTRSDAIARLNSAIHDYQGDRGPGSWNVDEHYRPDQISLYYRITGADEAIRTALLRGPERVWSEWGGDEILKAAELEMVTGVALGGTDEYTDSAIIAVAAED
jgi:hypothetical protein